uniref:Uncharacterized protein n=1 Tax=Solanum lycopersicum TaxID=4081 RepID=K4D7H4_SOLLC
MTRSFFQGSVLLQFCLEQCMKQTRGNLVFVHRWKNVLIRFTRRTYIMPSVPLEAKYHPSAVDIFLMKQLTTET